MKKLLLAAITCLATLAGTMAQSHLVFRNLNMSDGMSDNFVRSIRRDSYGLMWFVSMNGVDRFDGYHFRHYNVERDPYWRDGLHEIYETADSTLWITGSTHNYIYHSHEDYIDSHVSDALRKYGIHDSVGLMYVDDRRNLWCLSATSPILYHYDYDRHALSIVTMPAQEKAWHLVCRNHEVRMLTTGQNGSSSVWKIDVKRGSATRITQAPCRAIDRSRLYIDPWDRLWLFTIDQEQLWRWSDERQQWDDVAQLAGLQRKMFVYLDDDGDGHLWIGTSN